MKTPKSNQSPVNSEQSEPVAVKHIVLPGIAFFTFLCTGLEAASRGWYLIAVGLFVLTAFAGILVISIGGRTL